MQLHYLAVGSLEMATFNIGDGPGWFFGLLGALITAGASKRDGNPMILKQDACMTTNRYILSPFSSRNHTPCHAFRVAIWQHQQQLTIRSLLIIDWSCPSWLEHLRVPFPA